jgi:uncharacterized protein (TIGR03435 family)
MRIMRQRNLAAAALLFAAATPNVLTQAGPTYEVVSIRRSATGPLASSVNTQRADGGIAITNTPVSILINRAYPGMIPAEMVGLPDWARRENYDVSAKSPLSRPATADERILMLRSMLADRFKLMARVEKREQDVYDLVLARADGRLGPGLKLVDANLDCEARAAAAASQPAAPPRLDPNGPVAACAIFTKGPQMEANVTMSGLATFLRGTAGRFVVDKTGLKGMYHVALEYDRLASVRGPDAVTGPGGPPSVFTAVQEQLGLKLESSRGRARNADYRPPRASH